MSRMVSSSRIPSASRSEGGRTGGEREEGQEGRGRKDRRGEGGRTGGEREVHRAGLDGNKLAIGTCNLSAQVHLM